MFSCRKQSIEKWNDLGEDNSNVKHWHALLDRLGGYHSVNYEKAIVKGLLGIITEVQDEMATTAIKDDESLSKVIFLKACAIALKAGIRYAERYAVLAREMAETAEGERKAELEKIAGI